MSLSIRPSNNGEFFRRMQQLQGKIDRAKKLALFRAGTDMQKRAVELAPVKTSDLRRSITIFPQSFSAIKDHIIIGPHKIYARIHDLGGVIKPKTKKMLAWQSGGKWHFAKQVKIPKYKGRGYMTPAFREIKRRFPQIMREEINAVLRSK